VFPGVYVLAATVLSCDSRCICSGSYRIILCFQVYMFWQLPYYLVFPATVVSCVARCICSGSYCIIYVSRCICSGSYRIILCFQVYMFWQLLYYLVFPGIYVLAASVLSCVSRCISPPYCQKVPNDIFSKIDFFYINLFSFTVSLFCKKTELEF